jgi:8-hydroxy-5-deazaflavin:NADPH oxidoreductase
VRIGVIGAGRIGSNAARLFRQAGHEVFLSYSRDVEKLRALADGLGASYGAPGEAVAFGEVVMLSVPWATVDDALAQAGPLDGKIVVDTTNQFGPGGVEHLPEGLTAAQLNLRRMPGARLVKAFNTLTAGFQAEAAGRGVAMFLAGEDAAATEVVANLIRDIGFAPVDVGGWAEVSIMEAPRRDGAVYGEEYSGEDGRRIAAALRAGDADEAARLAVELRVA